MKARQFGILLTGLTVTFAAAFAGNAAAFSPFKTVTFYQNSFLGDSVTSTETRNATTALTKFSSLSPVFVNSGSNFSTWNTQPDGSGTNYADGQSFSFTTSISLYAVWIRQFHTATFYRNISSSDSTSCTQASNVVTALTRISSLCAVFSNPGYQFSGWNTSVSGNGNYYSDGSSYNFATNVSLYAVWAPIPTGTVTFNSNGSDQAISPITAQVGASIDLPQGSSLVKPGYTFIGWNTLQNGNGQSESAGATFQISGDSTLWAIWLPNTYTVSFLQVNGENMLASQQYVVGGSPLSLPFPTRTGYVFLGWFDQPTAGTQIGIGNASYSPTESLNLYGRWQVATYIVTLNTAGGNVRQAVYSYVYGSSALQLPIATRLGYVFDGWYLASDGVTFVGSGNSYLFPTMTQTLIAKWTIRPNFSVSFDPNGGLTSAIPVAVGAGDQIRLPAVASTSRNGEVLIGWSTDPTSTAPEYLPDQVVTPTSDVSFFAVWATASPWQIYSNVGIFSRNNVGLTSAMKRVIVKFADYIKKKKIKEVRILGYSAFSGNTNRDTSLSISRASAVARYLINELNRLKVRGVSINSSGQGSLPTNTSVLFSTVEMVFG
jgi:uncharacterized repeat protein (TIGR02543 family)